jgi:hypothetical protein
MVVSFWISPGLYRNLLIPFESLSGDPAYRARNSSALGTKSA